MRGPRFLTKALALDRPVSRSSTVSALSGRRDASGKQQRDDRAITQFLERLERRRAADVLKARIFVRPEKYRQRFIVWPMLAWQEVCSRVVGAQTEQQEVAREPVHQLQIAQARRRTRLAVASEVSEEAADVVSAEVHHRDATAPEIPMEAGEHRTVLNDGALGKRAPVRTRRLSALPFGISRFRVRQPEFGIHKCIY
ncbi:hypothetical protein [Paraburkholderia sp. MM5477-R1]|uniref:hypothetical protein n=1 Tax=Paraburkholderia sp. MM5477-R1 TaxID=2991062 RepID=UPI003D21D680